MHKVSSTYTLQGCVHLAERITTIVLNCGNQEINGGKIIPLFNISCLLCLTKQNSSSCYICFPQEVFSHTGVLPSVAIFHFVYNQGPVCLKSVVCVLSVTNCYTILKPLHCWLRFPCRLAR